MSGTVHAVLLRDVALARLADALKKKLASAGYDPITTPDADASTLRFNLRASGPWIALVAASSGLHRSGLGNDLESPAAWLDVEWAAHLSRVLASPALAISLWNVEGEGAVLRRVAKGKEVARLTLPDDAKPLRKTQAPLDTFAPWLAPRPGGRKPVLSLENGRATTMAAAIARILGIERAWLDPDSRDALEPGDLVLAFRRRAPLPAFPRVAKGAKPRTGHEQDVAAYRGRTHAVGTISFGAACELETVSKLISTFVRAFCPRDGLRVRVARGTRSEVLGIRFSQTASISATQLERGGSVELSESEFDMPLQPTLWGVMRPLFWVTSRTPAPEDGHEDKVRLTFGWCIARPRAERAELAISEAMSAMLEAAVDAKDCLAALVAAQGRPLTLADTVLPYESLAGTAGRADDARWLRHHVRSPAWRVLVPKVPARALSRPPPPGVSLQRVRGGLLVGSDAATPFAMTATEAIETWLLPASAP